ncbi:hypothetical protein NEF87_002216 [Candidatus Lokiarchaeum ossiferum]|uniref:Uncharacterized protein n=1 Tax=Candidatus Lokiarchaeum ossiferum TaxID=2951803 RepID=A0ABY6HTP6_9ARCH|nr:hypothetical protein NEF87_002216 [Candidatus Lokiarchaeum sp. B-35]
MRTNRKFSKNISVNESGECNYPEGNCFPNARGLKKESKKAFSVQEKISVMKSSSKNLKIEITHMFLQLQKHYHALRAN